MLKLKVKISQIVADEIKDYKEKRLNLDEGYFSQYDTIRLINLYVNSQFLNRNKTAENLIFWNIVNSRRIHFAKNIDLDTKDLLPIGKGDTNFWQSWILKLKFKFWMRTNHISILLNDLSEGVSTYGSMVWKKYTDYETGEVKLAESDLRRLAFKTNLKSVRDGNIVETHYLTETQIRKKDGAWDNINDLIKNAKRGMGKEEDLSPNALYEIWERVGEVIDINNKIHYTHYIGAGYGDKETIAFEDEIKPKDNPYYDFHIGKFCGRWLRVGIVERLFDLQLRANTVVNQNAQASQIASLLLMRSNDSATYGNVLQGTLNGQIIHSSDLQQIGIDNRAFNTLLGELDRIEKQADELCFTPAAITGDMKPSQIGFRGMVAQINAAKSAFAYIRETIGEEIANLLTEEILPAVVKKWNRGDMIDMIDEAGDMKMFDEAVVEAVKIRALKQSLKDGKALTPEELQSIETETQANIEKTGRKLEIPKGFFNFKYGLTLNVTGENADKNQQNDAYFNILTMIQQNPAIQSNPYFRQYVENNGITPIRMTAPELQQNVQDMKQGAVGNTQSQQGQPNQIGQQGQQGQPNQPSGASDQMNSMINQ